VAGQQQNKRSPSEFVPADHGETVSVDKRPSRVRGKLLPKLLDQQPRRQSKRAGRHRWRPITETLGSITGGRWLIAAKRPQNWLLRVKRNKELNHVSLTDNERTGYLPKLIEDLIVRLREPNTPGEESDSVRSAAAVAHGKLRQQQGYSAGMLVHDSRILQVTLFEMLQSNVSALDFSLLLPDVMTIADEVDSQLTQAMDSYMNVVGKTAAA